MKRSFHFYSLSLGVVGIAISLQQLFYGHEWIKPFFYIPAWMFYLLFIDGLNGTLSGASRLSVSPKKFIYLCLLSVPWWLLFEFINLRLGNWAYVDLPRQKWIRWPGYALSFATVLPAVLETGDFFFWLLRNIGQSKTFPEILSDSNRRTFIMIGGLSFFLPLIWPRYFFPLIWGFFFFIFEPKLANIAPEKSWLSDLSLGRSQRFYALLLSGFICGILWEFFNYWAGAKWIYAVPWPRGPKLFEMPLLGFLGFPPFALECATFWSLCELYGDKFSNKHRIAILLGLIIFSLLTFGAIDKRTARSFQPIRWAP